MDTELLSDFSTAINYIKQYLMENTDENFRLSTN